MRPAPLWNRATHLWSDTGRPVRASHGSDVATAGLLGALLINSAVNHYGPCFRPANLDFITGTYGTSTVHYCTAPAPWPSGNLIPVRRQVNWDCLKIAALSLLWMHTMRRTGVCCGSNERKHVLRLVGMWMWFPCSCWKLEEFGRWEMFQQKYAAYI